MEFIQWKSDYDIGETRIDIQHRHLVSLINMLHAGVNANMGVKVVGDILDELAMYVSIHFGYEEKFMEASGYPDFEAHKALHEDLRNKLDQFRMNYDHDPSQPTEELCNFLHEWLMDHVLEEDKKLSTYT